MWRYHIFTCEDIVSFLSICYHSLYHWLLYNKNKYGSLARKYWNLTHEESVYDTYWEQMRRNCLSSKTRKAGIIAKYYSPDTTFEQGLRNTVKCASIVEKHGEKLPLKVQVKFNVDAIFGSLLWRQINKSCCFCIHLTAWLFLQWRKGEGKCHIH